MIGTPDHYSAYSAYLIFFHAEVARLGPVGVLEEYVFSSTAVRPSDMTSQSWLRLW